ncbi:MAG: twin-arginine translocase subunit TatC [Deltaproteobacteria bacterium]|nr:twin-arginine translocase subunit TatC [Deltaproteobacteria bacterium]
MDDGDKMPFLSHLEELRKRLIACAIAVGIGFVVCYAFRERLFLILVSPLKGVLQTGDKLIYTHLLAAFLTYLKTAAVAGVLLAAPYLFYQIWMFIAPGLYQHEKKYVIPFVVYSTLLFVGGALFGYFIVFPFGFQYFLSFENAFIQPLPSINEYFSLAIRLLFCFGIAFELPVIIYFLTKIGIVTPESLKKKRKYAVLLMFIVSAILTPPDPASQVMMALPLIILYEIGIIVAKLVTKKKAKKEEMEVEQA